jgi:hypothetical protein
MREPQPLAAVRLLNLNRQESLVVSVSTTDEAVNAAFEARRRNLEGNVNAARAALTRANEIRQEIADAYWVAQEIYDAHLHGENITRDQAARRYAHGKATLEAAEAENDVALAIEYARGAVEFAQRLKAEAEAAKQTAARLKEKL